MPCPGINQVTMQLNKKDRQPAVAGSFYPADAAELRKMISGFTVSGKPNQTTGLEEFEFDYIPPQLSDDLSLIETVSAKHKMLPKDEFLAAALNEQTKSKRKWQRAKVKTRAFKNPR